MKGGAPPWSTQTPDEVPTKVPPGTPTASPTPTEQPVPAPRDYCRADPEVPGDDPLKVDSIASELFRCEGTALDNFEELSLWEARAGSLSANTTAPYSGSQSAFAEAMPSDERAWIYRTFDPPLDLTNTALSLSIKLDVPATEGIVVRLAAPDYRNAVFMGKHIWASGWTRVDLGPRRIRGSPDLSAVTEISVQMYTGGGTHARFSVDSLRMRPRRESGAVVFTFNGNYRSQYEQAFPTMQRYGVQGAVGVIPGTAAYDSKISVSSMREMQAAGWDMMSQPQVGPSFREMTQARQERVLRRSKRWLLERGFERGSDFLVWPFGQYDRHALETAGLYHRLGFAGGENPVGMITSPLTLGRVDGPEIETVERTVDLAAEYNLVVPIAYQEVANMRTGVSMKRFEAVLEYVDASGLEVVTPSELWASLG